MNVLTQRIGPLPAWVWGVVAAGGVWFFLLRGKTGTSSATKSTTPGSQATTDYSLGYAQGLQAGNVQPPAAAPTTGPQGCPPDTPFNLADWAPYYGTWEYKPNGQYGVFVKNCVSYSHIDSPAAARLIESQGGKVYFFAVPGSPIPGALGSLWQATSLAQGVPGTPPSIGGPARRHAVGSRREAPMWHESHPLVGAPVPYGHFVRAVGGAANHRREIHRVASQAGVHPARVAMLNPHPTGMIRVA